MAAEIHPVLHYVDLDEAVAWLGKAFGAEEIVVHRDPEGTAQFAEVRLQGAPLGIGRRAGDDNPFDLGPVPVYVVLDDAAAVDAVHARAVGAGAEEVMPPTDQDYGSHDSAVRDHEGNVWCFGTFRPGSSS